MPYIEHITKYKKPSFAEQFLSGLLTSLPQTIGQEQKRGYEEKVIQALLQGGDVGTALQQKKPRGFLGNLFDIISPRGTYRGGMEGLSPITQMILGGKLGPMLRDPLETAAMQARTDLTKAQTQAMLEPRPTKPLTPSELRLQRKDIEEAMDDYITSAYTPPSYWGKQVGKQGTYNPEDLKKAWEQWLADYGSLLPEEKERLWGVWKTKVKAVTGQTMPEISRPQTKASMPQTGISRGGQLTQAQVRMRSPDGKLYDVDESEVEDAKKHGWIIVR